MKTRPTNNSIVETQLSPRVQLDKRKFITTGAILAGAAALSGPKTASAATNLGIVSVTDFASPQAALNASGGKIVIFPAGLYTISAELRVQPNTTVMGTPGAIIKQTDNSKAVFRLEGTASTPLTGITIQGLALEGAGGTNSFHAGVYLDSCTNCRVINCTMRNLDLGIHVISTIKASTACEFVGNNITGTSDNGIGITAHPSYPAGPRQSKHIVAHNVVTNCGGATAAGKGIELRFCEKCVVANNVFEGNANGGLQLEQGCEGMVIEGNIIASNSKQGIILVPTDGTAINTNNTIANNIIRDNGAQGIWFNTSGTFNTITGNLIIANNGNGVDLNGPTRDYVLGNRIEGNEIRANGGNGIDLPNAWHDIVLGNYITANTGAGIALSRAGSENIISGNMVLNNNQPIPNQPDSNHSGIEVSGSQSFNVITGNVCKNDVANQGQHYGVTLEAGAASNIVMQNQLLGNRTGGISDASTSTTTAYNIGG